jgi:hypothetical protein
MPQRYSTEREFARHCGIPNGLKRYLLNRETTIGHQYTQFSRSVCPRFTSNVTKREPASAYIDDLTQCCKPMAQRGEAAVVDFESVILPPVNQLFPEYGSCPFLNPPLQLLFRDGIPTKRDEMPDLMSDVVSQSRCFEALTEEATLCQGPGVPILRVIGCLHSSDFVVSGPTVLRGFLATL